MNRQLVLDYLKSMHKPWISHNELRRATRIPTHAFRGLMTRMKREGTVETVQDMAPCWIGKRKVEMEMTFYRLPRAQRYTLDICKVPWLGTYIAEVPKGEGIVHRIEDDGEVE